MFQMFKKKSLKLGFVMSLIQKIRFYHFAYGEALHTCIFRTNILICNRSIFNM